MKPGLAAENLLGAALAGRAPRGEATPRREGDAGFAGLLDGARQQQGGRAGVYDGSAFDVREARPAPTAPRAGSAAEIERRQIDQRQQLARSDAQRDTEPPEPARDAERRAEARPTSPTNKPHANEVPRDASRAPRENDAVAEAEGGEHPAVEAQGDAAAPAHGESPTATPATPPTTQEWMARWATLSGAAGAPGQGEGEAATPTVALQRLAGAASAGDAAAAQVSGSPSGVPAVPDASAQAAGATAAPNETQVDASTLAAPAAARIEASAALPPGPTSAAAAGSSSLAAPATASVPVPLDAPDFSQALGWQLATLARDGVHEAQLRLNPAELGPVQVQILLDGGQAQIDFTAAQSRTRDVLEAGWPALAAAMHAAGFTLGGGGVFEQRPQDREAQGGQAGARSRRDGDDAEALALPGANRLAGSGPRGLLDLYA